MAIPRQLPNAITIVRILCAPIFLWMLLADGGADGPLRWWAAALFIVAIATDGIDAEELTRVTARLRYGLLASTDNLLRRTLSIASYEQQRGRAELTHEMPDLLDQVTAEQVAKAAASLRPDVRGRLDLIAGGAA